MDLVTYLTTQSSSLGRLGWAFFVLQFVAVAVGIFFAFVRSDVNPSRGRLFKRAGYVLLALGAIGVALGALRLGGVAPFTARYWFYILWIPELAFAIWALFYSRQLLREDAAPAQRSGSQRKAAAKGPAQTSARPAAPPHPKPTTQATAPSGTAAPHEPVAASGRREARRERKRRKK